MDYEFHPLAEAFPMMDSGDIDKLAEDIRANGQIVPAYLLGGKILDGRNRYMACNQIGIPLTVTNCEDEEDYHDDPVAFVASLNLHRRHMNPPKRAEALAELRKQAAALLRNSPEASNRTIAERVGIHHETVAAVREDLESTGEIRQLDKTTGKDGKSRPSTRKHTVRDSHSEATEPELTRASLQHLDESTGELTPAETSQAIVESFAADMARWSKRLNAVELEQHQVERCCEAVAKFVRTVKP